MSKHHNVANSEKPRERTLPILIVAILFLEFRLPLQPRTQHHRPVICRKPLDCLDPCTLHGTLFSTFPQAAQFARRLPLHDAHSATCWAYSTPLTHRVASSTGIMTNFFFFFGLPRYRTPPKLRGALTSNARGGVPAPMLARCCW